MNDTYFRKGFGLRGEVGPQLTADYHSALVELLKARDHRLPVGRLTFLLAREFGFCYGVDRAVEYAYQTRSKFPGKRLLLVGEIIHNPHVNRKLADMGIEILSRSTGGEFDFSRLTPDDVVIMPAFGVTVADFERLRGLGCVMVDTTCGSVLNVWKRVETYARDGFTAVIHGKYYHEETKATASQVTKYPGGRYLIVLNMEEARLVCDFIEGKTGETGLRARLGGNVSPGFDFARDLVRVGLANQTTMLAGESLAIAEEFRQSMIRRYGPEAIEAHFRSFDTICSATQERQDALMRLLGEPLDAMVVIGGYNSSNTTHLAKLCHHRGVRTYHVEDAHCLGLDGTIRHQPVGSKQEVEDAAWLEGTGLIGVTAGASTPNNKIGEAIARICAAAGLSAELDAMI